MSKSDITMQDVLRELESQIGAEAFSIYEWYCKAYDVSLSDKAPASVIYEVFGI